MLDWHERLLRIALDLASVPGHGMLGAPNRLAFISFAECWIFISKPGLAVMISV